MLRRPDPREGTPLPHLRRPANALRPDLGQPAFPLCERDRQRAAGSGRQSPPPQRDTFQDNDWSQEERIAQPAHAGLREQPHTARRPSGTRAAPAAYRQPAPKTTQPLLQLRKGEMVRHAAVGTGMVLSIQPMGGDALVEVAFDNVGTKRMMLKAASQFMSKV